MSTPAVEAARRPAPVTPAAAAAGPAPLRLPPAPRRVSGPSRGHPRAVGARVLAPDSRLTRLLDHHWLDRLIRGRTWIAIVTVVLLAIVAMQVALLRLGADIGAVTTQVNAQIQSNQTALATIASLQSGAGVRHQAVVDGLVDPPPDQVVYLSSGPADAVRAAARMHSPAAAATAADIANRQAAAARSTTAAGAPVTSARTTAASHAATGATAATGAATAPPTGATGASAATAPTGAATAPSTPSATTPPSTTATQSAGTPAGTTTAAGTRAGTPATSATTATPPPVSSQGGAVAPPGN